MVNAITLLNDERIQYDGPFDLGEFYKHAYNFLFWRKFDITEKRYTEKNKAAGKEFRIEWEANKFFDEYSKILIKVRFELYQINDIEVKTDTKVKKMQKGEVNVYVTAELWTDRQDYWAQNVFFSFMRGFYDRYIYRSSIERLKAEVWKNGWDFFNELKAFLQLYRY
jgi:hypothetical protein